jgi:hypothetical protein
MSMFVSTSRRVRIATLDAMLGFMARGEAESAALEEGGGRLRSAHLGEGAQRSRHTTTPPRNGSLRGDASVERPKSGHLSDSTRPN